ncbi:MAG: two-component regulator propeller domain-containing protein [Pseudomonadota bacterium]
MQSSSWAKKLLRLLSLVGVAIVMLMDAGNINLAQATNIPEQISFKNIVENKDIPLGEAASLFQDSEGFVWLGGGTTLVRYDGYEFKQVDINVSEDPGDTSPVYYVETIFEDSRHRLWIGSRSGLLLYEPRKETLIRIEDDKSQTLKLSESTVTKIIELPTGELVAGSLTGIHLINPVTLKYTSITPDPTRSHWLKSSLIESMLVDSNNDIWLGTEAGLEKLDWQTKTFTFFNINLENPESLQHAHVTDMISDQDGKFWLATRHGLVHFDPKTKQQQRYLHDHTDRFSLGSNAVWTLLMDSHGILWVGTDSGGVSIYDSEKDRFINHRYEAGHIGSLSSNVVRSLLEDRNGDIWVGTYPTGINLFDRSSSPFTSYESNVSNPKSLSHTAMQAVAEDGNGNLWLGTDGGGLNFFDREKNEFTHFKTNPNDITTISANAVLTSHIDSEGLVWVGTWAGGISSYNPASKKFTRYPFDHERKTRSRVSSSLKLNAGSVWSVKEDRERNLWISTHTGGISKYNRHTKIFTHYEHMNDDPQSLSSNLVWTSHEDTMGNLWVGTAGGLSLLNHEAGTFTSFIPDPANPSSISNSSVFSILEDGKKRLWFGTGAGLNLFNPETGKFTVFNKKNGFLNDAIKSIVEDTYGVLWVNTDNGFSSFDPESKKIKNYNRLSGRLVGDFKTNSGIRSRNGEIVFGGTNGLRIINPLELSENKTVATVVFTDFKIFTDSVTVGGAEGNLQYVINHSETLTLDYNQSMFTFNFAVLNYRDSEKNKYAYKLDGFDKNWVDGGTQRTAKYTNLNSGTYVFTVKGSNNDGVWNETGKSIRIIQLPPPWKTWWAYLIYSLLLILIIVQFVHSQRKKRLTVEEQNRELETKVQERTAELREKTHDIQTMLSNIQQGLFTIEPGGNIHPEYSHYLEEIFETNDIANKNALTLLFGRANIGSDTFALMKAAVNTTIGEDKLNFELNSHLLISEYVANFSGNYKHLTLDWNSVVVGNIVTKLMVSVRDVTLLKKMETEARAKKRELDIISQLLNVPSKKYLGFAESAKRFIAENRKQLENNKQYSDAIIALLFRNLHTIKGNCRTFGFDYFSDVVHEVESVYSALKAQPNTPLDRDKLLNDLVRVEGVLHEYEDIYYNLLGRSENSAEQRDQNGFWADKNAIAIIQQSIDTAHQQYPVLHKTQPLLPIQSLLNRSLSTSLSDVLTSMIASLPSIALELNKALPRVTIDDHQVSIKCSAIELITNIFGHILRNSIDHGIETAEVRVQAGKPASGTIEIRAIAHQDYLRIHVKDDGQGINIDKLFQKGIEIGQWKAGDKPSYNDIANLIFISGVSTKEHITSISGRGVGMDAVKEFLLANNGSIFLQLLNTDTNAPAIAQPIGKGVRTAFELVIELPKDMFTIVV